MHRRVSTRRGLFTSQKESLELNSFFSNWCSYSWPRDYCSWLEKCMGNLLWHQEHVRSIVSKRLVLYRKVRIQKLNFRSIFTGTFYALVASADEQAWSRLTMTARHQLSYEAKQFRNHLRRKESVVVPVVSTKHRFSVTHLS